MWNEAGHSKKYLQGSCGGGCATNSQTPIGRVIGMGDTIRRAQGLQVRVFLLEQRHDCPLPIVCLRENEGAGSVEHLKVKMVS